MLPAELPEQVLGFLTTGDLDSTFFPPEIKRLKNNELH